MKDEFRYYVEERKGVDMVNVFIDDNRNRLIEQTVNAATNYMFELDKLLRAYHNSYLSWIQAKARLDNDFKRSIDIARSDYATVVEAKMIEERCE